MNILILVMQIVILILQFLICRRVNENNKMLKEMLDYQNEYDQKR